MSKRAYAIIAACFFTVSIAYSIRYGYGMLLPEMLPALGISKTQAGTIFAVYFIVYTIFTPIMGTLSDLFNFRLLLTVFPAVLGLGALMMAQVTGFAQACLFFSIAGLGHAACWAPVASLVQKWVPDNKRGTALSVVSIGIGLGIPLWSGLLPVLVSEFGWRTGWISMGVFGMAVAVLNLILVRNPEAVEERLVSAHERIIYVGIMYKTLLRSRGFWMVGMSYLLIGFNVLVPFTFLPVYATESLHLDYAVSTRFVGIIALMGVIGQLTLGPLSDRIGRGKVMILCSSIMGTACLGMALAGTAGTLYAAAGLYGLAYGAVWPMYAAAASDSFPRNQTGSVVGLWTVFLGLGSIISPVICGWTIDITGVYTWAFLLGLLAGFFSIGFLIAYSKIRESTSA